MEHYAHISPEEMLYLYIDGELGTEHDEALFAHLAANPDLRVEMRDLLALRHGVQKDILLPDPALKSKMLAAAMAAGAAESAVITGAATAPSGSGGLLALLSRLAIPLGSALVGAAIMFFAMTWNSDPSGDGTHTAQTTVQQEAAHTDGVAGNSAPVNSSPQAADDHKQQAENPTHSTAQAFSDRMAQVYRSVRENAPVQLSVPRDNQEDGPSIFAAPDNSNRQIAIAQVELKQGDVPVVRESALPNDFAPVSFDRFPPESSGPAWRLRIRSVAAGSFPSVSIPSDAGAFPENISASVQYLLDSVHSIGLEVGRERFAQVFTGIDAGRLVRYEQSPILTWGGVSYSFRPALFGDDTFIRPFADGAVGLALPGFPLGRLATGVELTPETRISMSFGIEGTLLLYRHEEAWFTTRKLGFTYGLSYRL